MVHSVIEEFPHFVRDDIGLCHSECNEESPAMICETYYKNEKTILRLLINK